MDNADKLKQVLISRYSKLNNISAEKGMAKFEANLIDAIIRKNEQKVIIGIVLFAIVVAALIIQLILLFKYENINIGLVGSICFVMLFQKGLHDILEEKNILKALKDIS